MFKPVIVLLGALSLSGCATIVRGTTDTLTVKSTPPGAQVKLSSGESCNSTPCTFKLPRKSELNVQVAKAGCEPQTIRVTNKVSGRGGTALAANVVSGGIVGIGVDAISGAGLDLVPNPVEATLNCRPGS